MTNLDDRMSSAMGDLRGELDQFDPPPFKPKRNMAPVALAVIVLLGIGAIGLATRSQADTSGSISVATQPDDADEADVPGEADAPSETLQTETVQTEPLLPLVGQLTSARAGEFLMPVSGSAWNSDETLLLLYRTGNDSDEDISPGHVVIDTTTGDVLVELPFTPPDIEQAYWHPTLPNEVLYADGAALMSYNVETGTSSAMHTFNDCDRVDSGRLPVPPSLDGTISLLCHQGSESVQVSYHLSTQVELRTATASDSAAFPSPSGTYLVRANDDGSASVLDAALNETGTRLDLDGNLFAFVTDDAGREWAVATLFDGNFVGSVVALPLDGGEPPTVIVGPDRGDAYPPSGTLIVGSAGQVAIAIAGADDGSLAGRVTRLGVGDSFANPDRTSTVHGSIGSHNYWSKPFLSLSPSGRFVAWSSDQASDRIDTFITDFGGPTG